ncbi:BamA/TamA family outer membrane protein [Chondrinema litorale]|uniref:translocation and assembly module lipoprotein TamL n=1 Tax=Chondrinema litorale TaxID=2994555 RepID=UPI002542C91A|nr:BamA/TamA family outer membrane protein [Chondrinema litorale]UZR93995.1 BamA/TamA family outer membrane protein [Chondrinema litorale]
MKVNWFLYIIIFFILIYISGCIPTNQLAENEYLLYSQKIKQNKKIPDEDLEVYYRQKPNRKILYLPIMPYLYAYYAGKQKYEKRIASDSLKLQKIQDKYNTKISEKQQKIISLRNDASYDDEPKKLNKDTTRINRKIRALREKMDKKLFAIQERLEKGNVLMRTVGSPPVLYDSTPAQYTADQMTEYLKYKGYLDGYVVHSADTVEKLVTVSYTVNEGDPYIIDSIIYEIPDSAVYKIVVQDKKNSLIKKGAIYDEENLEKERARLSRLVQNKGYFDFGQRYIYYRVNDTLSNNKLQVTQIIKNTEDFNTPHKKYKIDEVFFYTDVDVSKSNDNFESEYNNISFIEEEKRYSKKVLNNKVFIRPDSLYSLQKTEDTQIALGRLDIFKFVNVLYDTTGEKMRANIFTSPHPRYQYSLEAGLNVSQSAIPGPFASLSLKKRNLLGGLEIFETRIRGAIEAQTGATEQQNFRGQEYGINFSLSFPRILFPIRSKHKNKLSMLTPSTQLLGGFGFVDRPEYTRFNIQSALNYQWRNRKSQIFNLNIIDLSVINTTRLDSAFEERLVQLLNQGSTLIYSFDRSLVSSINASFTKSKNAFDIQSKKTSFLRVFLETGGTFFNLWNRTNIATEEKILGLRYFRFLKGFVDFRNGFPLGKSGQFATRLAFGIAKPYGTGSRSLPYEKYFFTGGSNSNRAWAARRIGPGSYSPDTLSTGAFDYSFEQPGEIIFESSLELRRNLFSFFDGAIFMDASNIWMIEEDATRPGAKFESDFWKELAIGVGAGLRLNFDFLLIRFDLGVKMYDPARDEGDRYIGDNITFKNPLGAPGQYTLNLGIGYPF